MFELDLSITTKGIIAFILVFVQLVMLVLYITEYKLKNYALVITLFVSTLIALSVSSYYVADKKEEEKRQVALMSEVSELLKVEEEQVNLASIKLPDFDYTLLVNDETIGVEYDFKDEEIKSLVSTSKYLYGGTK
jgi:hypothetical protein